MKHALRTTLVGIALGCATAPALADTWRLLPSLDEGYRPAFTLSVAGGVMDPKGAREGAYGGVELAMNCGLLQTPSGVVRTKLSLGRYDKGDTELRIFEVNPRWTTPLTERLSAGVGPGIGYVRAKVAGRDTDLFAWQLGADLDYRLGRLNLGLGARWQDTVDKTIAPGREGAENWLVQAKVGVNF